MPIRNPTPVDALPVNGILERGISSDWAFDHAALPTAHQDAPALIATHAADLDAHMPDRLQILRTGEHVIPFHYHDRGFGVNTLKANQMEGIPFFVPRSMTFDRISICVTTGHATGCRLGIYANGTNLYPGVLLLDAGVVDVTATGIKSITISQQLTKGLWWLAIASQGTSAIRSSTSSAYAFLGVNEATWDTGWIGWYVAHTYGALPNPFTAGGSKEYIAYMPALRLLSLD